MPVTFISQPPVRSYSALAFSYALRHELAAILPRLRLSRAHASHTEKNSYAVQNADM